MYQTSPCHILVSSSPLSCSSYFTFSHYVNSTLNCFATRAHLCTFSLPLSTNGMPFSYFVAGPGPLREIAVSAFSRSRLDGVNTFLFPSLLTPRISPGVPALSPCFFALAFPLFLRYHMFCFCLVPPKLIYAKYLLLVCSIRFHTFVQLALLLHFPHTSLSAMTGSLLFGFFLRIYCPFIWGGEGGG